jgi:cellulose synthase/poly-beta-1,6-N-acetylglucosamine synthase-like glycosyltransferase
MNIERSISEGSTVSVIVPARNEEACLANCLKSLVAQTGIEFEIIVVNDHSTDGTREIAEAFVNPHLPEPGRCGAPAVRVIDAPELPRGWYGKANACVAGARAAKPQGLKPRDSMTVIGTAEAVPFQREHWLLFTDADTVHKPGSLARAVAEASEQGADLLSYSPAQEVHGIVQRAVMPVIFAELAATYKPKQVCDRASAAAAANGQYLLIRREAYDAVGGHVAVATDLLEDVALARAVKQSGRKLSFRFGGDAVSTRMYRTRAQMREGWAKNLVLLFPDAMRLALLRGLEFFASAGALTTALAAFALGAIPAGIVAGAIAVPT